MSKLHVDIDASPTEIRFTRVFNAPKRLVKKAMTEPELIKKWSGGKRAIVTEATHDVRVGGSYKTAYKTHDGYEFFFTGEYLEVSDDKIVHTECFNGDPNGSTVTITMKEEAGVTTVYMIMAFPSQEIRDMVVKTGMADGAGESYDELDTLLANL